MKKKILLLGLTFIMGISLLATGVSPPNTNATADAASYNTLDEAFIDYANWSKVLSNSTNNSNIQDFLIINNINNNGSVYYETDKMPRSGLNTEISYLLETYNYTASAIAQEDTNYNQNSTSGNNRTSQRLAILTDNKYKLNSFASEINTLVIDDGNGNINNMQELAEASDVVIVAGNIGTTENNIFGILINDGENKLIYAYQEAMSNANYMTYIQNGYNFVSVNEFNSTNLSQDQKVTYLRYIALLYAGGYTTTEIDNFIKTRILYNESLEDTITALNEYQGVNCQHLFYILDYEQATCTSNGSCQMECEVCEFETTKTLSPSEIIHTNLITYTSDRPHNQGSISSKCGEPIMQVKECLDCNYIEQTNLTQMDEDGNVINVLKEHSYKKLSSTSSTCIERGKNTYRCMECGDVYETDRALDSSNHMNVTYKTVKEPTCSEQGYKTLYCSDCETSIGEKVYIDTLEHEWVQSNTSIGDCKVSSSITYTCTKCNEERIEYGQTGTNHNQNYIKERIVSEPTCSKEGVVEEYCENCDVVVSTKSIPVINHSYIGETTVEGTCTTKEETTYTCSVCDDSYVVIGDTVTDEHKTSEWFETKKATCSTQGEETLICNECGEKLSTKKTDYAEHTYEEKITVEPTCSTYGECALICTECGDVKSTQKTAKISHTPIECEDGVVRCEICNAELGYIVTYDANGGECDKTSDYGEVGTNIILPTATKEGYIFNGWYNELGVKVTSLKITSNVNLKAMWTSIPIKITYNANGGQASEQTQTYYIGDVLELPTATRNGYIFDGWYINDTLLTNETTIDYSDSIVATAKWSKLELEKPKVIKATKNSLTVETVEGAIGYQVYISANTKFKPRSSYSSTQTTINLAEMTRGGTYIAIRTVGKDSTGNYVYSAWKYYKY